MQRPKLFISYSHPDEIYKVELVKHLSTMKRNHEVEIWNDRMINPGEEWDKVINSKLLEADIILLLVSSDFIASDYCNDIEVKKAVEKHNLGKAKVIPIIVRSCDWKTTIFAKLQALPKDGKPLKNWSDIDEAFLFVIEGIRQAINERTPHLVSSPDNVDILDSFPVFPMVEPDDVPRVIIEAISKTVPFNEAETLINEANRLRKKANPTDKNVTIIELHKIQHSSQIAPYDFWMKVISQARLHGPKMLAALLLTVSDSSFTEEAKREKQNLLEILKSYKK
ncbi:toll/interleukin-1 receptor domain-containing protein [Foetidibacter luteolus]|uniref:toll/interleukin-1 receptor domain-containing protein n=1 Tax=Foetidibacter luteolus TaxID=2608880 RepID=UPI00129B887B|nr:toll/interleukin-1 receptor domain-containing protein [Foetidibacter luteolus]